MNKEILKQKIINFLNTKINLKMGIKSSYLLVGVTSSLVTVFLIGSIVWVLRGQIFGYFASEYLENSISGTVASDEDTVAAVTPDLLADIVQKKVEISSDVKREGSVIETVKKTNPAVVSIILTKEVPKYEVYNNPNQTNPFGDLFPGFNFNIPQYKQNGTEKKEVGGGSGFFVSADGLIVTNRHVVSGEGVEYTVYTNDGKKYPAKVVARDAVLDIALIKVTGSGFAYLSLGDSDTLEIGQTVVAIGNALAEFKNTVSVGVISGLSRSITAGDGSGSSEFLDKVIQTDAAINPGNSGGPLLNLYGQVVGVNVAVAQGGQNIAFALPINNVKSVIESVKATGKIVRPYLGIRYVLINPEIKTKNNLSVDYGVLIKSGASAADLAVIPGSPADKAGLVENDIILEVDGKKLDEDTNISSLVRYKKVGDAITLKILHKGEQKVTTLILGAAKD